MLVRNATDRDETARARRANQRGFTVLETAVAMLVMMVVGLGATSLFLYAVRFNAGASDRAMALAVAQQQLEELRAVPWDDPLLTATQAAGTAVCTQNAPCYTANRPFLATKIVTDSMNVTINGVTRPTMKTITIQVTPLRGGMPWTNGAVSVTAQRATLLRGPN